VKQNKKLSFFKKKFSDVDIFPELQQISMANLCQMLQQEHDASHMIAQKSQPEDPKIVCSKIKMC